MQQSPLLQRGVRPNHPGCFRAPLAGRKVVAAVVDRRNVLVSSSKAAAVATAPASSAPAGAVPTGPVRVRFAPSPTGNLHVGGARTALFNWLYAKRYGGKLILRIEDTDTARSTRESEDMMTRDLRWLGLHWDEGPDVGGPHGPYRQSERTEIYKQYADQLVASGKAYHCFCTDAEIDAMKKEAAELNIPPIYRGKWAHASKAEVDAMVAQGVPYVYRFRVPKSQVVTIQDVVRGEVSWNTDTLGDFVLLRSSGQPVYNFCVAIDDCLMKITHVIRAEEHLSNTLRQVLIYDALGFQQPIFGHVSLILAPDKSKLSKRHGATSVGEFQAQGYLPSAMVNFLSLLGWNDGSEQEMFTTEELTQKFSLERITKSPAVFDKVKLGWFNGQYLRAMSDEEALPLVAGRLVQAGLVKDAGTPFVAAVTALIRNSLELVDDADEVAGKLLSYPFAETMASEEAKATVDDNMAEVVTILLAAADSGEMAAAAAGGHETWKKFVTTLGKTQKRRGKRIFMPLRIALTGRMAGPDVGEQLAALALENGDVVDTAAFVTMPERLAQLRKWRDAQPAFVPAAAAAAH